jgi:hypothetical protein
MIIIHKECAKQGTHTMQLEIIFRSDYAGSRDVPLATTSP